MTCKAFLISIGIKNLYKNFKLYNGYLKETGWNHSVKQTSSVDKFGEAIPWFTYPCFRFLNTRLKKDLKIFEFGSGNSTLWFSKNSQKVFSVEHDKEWFEKLKIDLSNRGNVDYVHRTLTNGDYKNEILEYENFFDIIIIDGRDRVNCIFNSLGALKKSGVIILDNSDRDRYLEAISFLEEKGFRSIDFWGIGPMNHEEWCTSIFYRSGNCLGI
ncbi:hypothetical protein ACNI3T_10910 [Christiangramia sp. ASW11-125]|uniref:hypothetical protein n=1 Tax=Christiangramia sp. ASW11-125 TaxID=3400701 RepID=UPI003AAD8F9C